MARKKRTPRASPAARTEDRQHRTAQSPALPDVGVQQVPPPLYHAPAPFDTNNQERLKRPSVVMAGTLNSIQKLEADLWEAADNLRANSKLTSSDYFMPVLGVIFLRHAANRFEAATRRIEQDRASGEMPKRKVLPADYLSRRALWLPESARYDWIMQKAASSGSDLP